MMNAISIIGAIASILGAVYAWRQATNAKRYSDKAGSQFAKQRSISELAHLKTLWKATYEILAPFGPSARPVDLRGKSTADAARIAQDFIAEVKNKESYLSSITDLGARCSTLHQHIADFSDAREDAMKKRGSILLSAMEDLNAAICLILSTVQEKVDLS